MTDYRIFGASVSGPSNSSSNIISFSSGNGSIGLEFYVNQMVYLKYAHIWRNNPQYLTSSTNFHLYQVTSKTGFTDVKGGLGNIPAGNGGWQTGQTNPILLVPGVRYKMAFFVGHYVHFTNDQFLTGEKYANGVGNSVIYAPGVSQTLCGSQMTYDGNAGYPNTDYSDTNFWVDITVTDAGFSAPLILGATGSVSRTAAGVAPLTLGTDHQVHKRASQTGTAYMTLRASGRAFTSDSIRGIARLALGASGVVHHQASQHGEAHLTLGASGTSSKTTNVSGTAVLTLGAPVPADFWRTVADNVRDALLDSNWNDERQSFQEAAQTDAEALAADVMGGLFALSIGDHARAHETIRHLRNYRVKQAQIGGGHYHHPGPVQGYKPYGSLGAQAHPSPPVVVDQPSTWLAEIFKGNYGEPIGDDVRSLISWSRTWISAGPSALYGAQFLGLSRTIWSPTYQMVSRPQLVSAAWAYLASSGSQVLFPVDALPRPQVPAVELAARPDAPGRFRLDFTWTVTDEVPTAVYQNRLESRTDRYGAWEQVFEHLYEHQSDEVATPGGFAHVITVPQPEVTTQYRVWIRTRNALYGEWTCSNTVQIKSPASVLYPGPTTFPSPTTFPQG